MFHSGNSFKNIFDPIAYADITLYSCPLVVLVTSAARRPERGFGVYRGMMDLE